MKWDVKCRNCHGRLMDAEAAAGQLSCDPCLAAEAERKRVAGLDAAVAGLRAQLAAAIRERAEAIRLLHMLDNQEARHPDVAAFLDAIEADVPSPVAPVATVPPGVRGSYADIAEGRRQERDRLLAALDDEARYQAGLKGDYAICACEVLARLRGKMMVDEGDHAPPGQSAPAHDFDACPLPPDRCAECRAIYRERRAAAQSATPGKAER